jgi:hypothetical protein
MDNKKPKRGRIAVKVINHLGDEVMKVFRVKQGRFFQCLETEKLDLREINGGGFKTLSGTYPFG